MLRSTVFDADHGVLVHELKGAGAERSSPAWRLCYYTPGCVMPRHSHETAQFSILLAGSARETTGRGAYESSLAIMETKPAGFDHANKFGPDGALLLSVNLPQSGIPDGQLLRIDDWRLGQAAPVRREWRRLAAVIVSDNARLDELEEITTDLLAAVDDDAGFRRAQPPRWLARARAAVIETDASFSAIAADAGVHRVHLARSFRRCFDQSMSECRRQARLGAALRRVVHERADLCAAGHEAGFADQSHFTRTLKSQTGITPGRLARLFAG